METVDQSTVTRTSSETEVGFAVSLYKESELKIILC